MKKVAIERTPKFAKLGILLGILGTITSAGALFAGPSDGIRAAGLAGILICPLVYFGARACAWWFRG